MNSRRFSWSLVRSLGQLTLLTKVSYWALLFVPALAAAWTPLIAFLSARPSAASIAEPLRAAIARVSENCIEAACSMQSLETELAAITSVLELAAPQWQEAQSTSAQFPLTLLFAFGAAIFVIVGHTLYEIFAPSIVKRHALDDYEQTALRRYADYPTEGQLLGSTLVVREWLTGLRGRRLGGFERIRRLVDRLEENQQSVASEDRLEVIRLAATLEYESFTGMTIAGWLSLLAYGIAVLLLVGMLWSQTQLVLHAAHFVG